MVDGGFLHPLHIADIVDVAVLVQGIRGDSEFVGVYGIERGGSHGMKYDQMPISYTRSAARGVAPSFLMALTIGQLSSRIVDLHPHIRGVKDVVHGAVRFRLSMALLW